MWIRKSSAEIARGKQRKILNPLGPLLVTLFFTFVEWAATYDTADAFSPTSPIFLALFLVMFVFFYLTRIFFGKYIPLRRSFGPGVTKQAMICTRCYSIQCDNGTNTCACGGNLEKLDDWRWIEHENDNRNLSI